MLEWRLTRNGKVLAEGCAEDTEAWRQVAFMSIQLTAEQRDYPVIETREKGAKRWVRAKAIDQ